jgi:hypothetical protein
VIDLACSLAFAERAQTVLERDLHVTDCTRLFLSNAKVVCMKNIAVRAPNRTT